MGNAAFTSKRRDLERQAKERKAYGEPKHSGATPSYSTSSRDRWPCKRPHVDPAGGFGHTVNEKMQLEEGVPVLSPGTTQLTTSSREKFGGF